MKSPLAQANQWNDNAELKGRIYRDVSRSLMIVYSASSWLVLKRVNTFGGRVVEDSCVAILSDMDRQVEKKDLRRDTHACECIYTCAGTTLQMQKIIIISLCHCHCFRQRCSIE